MGSVGQREVSVTQARYFFCSRKVGSNYGDWGGPQGFTRSFTAWHITSQSNLSSPLLNSDFYTDHDDLSMSANQNPRIAFSHDKSAHFVETSRLGILSPCQF